MTNTSKTPSTSGHDAVFPPSTETSLSSFDLSSISPEMMTKETNKVFIRLFGDVISELNKAVDARMSQANVSQGRLATNAGQDPGFVSRVLAGNSGTNLRTVAAVLAMTRYRMKVEAVPCEWLERRADAERVAAVHSKAGALIAQRTGGVWRVTSQKSNVGSHERIFQSPVQAIHHHIARKEDAWHEF